MKSGDTFNRLSLRPVPFGHLSRWNVVNAGTLDEMGIKFRKTEITIFGGEPMKIAKTKEHYDRLVEEGNEQSSK